ncbi:MAG: GNAT family N-acetyltransferase [Gemmatimonadetes bacterium]|nr:GNAT family N-acetyltransferase [Gemmatimonadota bacterium]
MRVDTYSCARRIPAQVWDDVAPADFFFSRAFLRVMEESGVEDARYRYIVLHDGGRPIGQAVLSAFTLRLDLLARDPWIQRVRALFPRLLDVPIVCCGIPASYGQHHLHVARPEHAAEAVRAVHEAMESWAAEIGAGALFWKEWHRVQAAYGAIPALGYVGLPTLPDHHVTKLPSTIETFMASLRSQYRRKYRPVAELMNGPGPVWAAGALQLEDLPFTERQAAGFHRGYVSVLNRADVRLEMYPPAFFRQLASSPLDVRMLRLTGCRTGESLAALVVPSGDVLTFILVSKERAFYRDALYSNLLRCIVLYAIHNGFREVRLGQTSNYAKGSLGAEPVPLETFVRLRTAWQHELLKRFGHMLFPDTAVPRFHVFRDAGPFDARPPAARPLDLRPPGARTPDAADRVAAHA